MLRSMIDEVEEEIQTLKDMISGNNYDVEVCYVNDESDGYDETDEYDDEDYPDDGYDEDYPEDFEEDIDSDHDEDIDNAEEFEEDEDEVEVYNDIEDTKKHDRKVSAEFLTDTVFHVVTGEINDRLSEKDIALNESIELYKEGTILASKCKEQLQGIEKELKVLNKEE